MIEMIALALTSLSAATQSAGEPQRIEATGSATIRIVRAEPIRAETFDLEDPRARIVDREEDGRKIRLHLIEFE